MAVSHEMIDTRAVGVEAGGVMLEGDLNLPENAKAVILFAHGSGSSRFSRRNRFVAEDLNHAGLATLLIDLLTKQEEAVDEYTAELRFDIELLANRLVGSIEWLGLEPSTRDLPVG